MPFPPRHGRATVVALPRFETDSRTISRKSTAKAGSTGDVAVTIAGDVAVTSEAVNVTTEPTAELRKPSARQ